MADADCPVPSAGKMKSADKFREGAPERLLRAMFQAAVAAADPAKVLKDHLPQRPAGRCVVVGAGKAAASMAAALETAWSDVAIEGTVVTPYGYGSDCQRIHVREAGHPLPDHNSVGAAKEILRSVADLKPEDLVLALISGGGSAAMCLPATGLTLDDKRIANRLLLASGLDIRTMNAVRRRMSAIKGGKLAAAAAPARVVTLAISDIPGDDPSAIASGPTIEPTSSGVDLAAVVRRLGKELPQSVRDLLLTPEVTTSVSGNFDVRLIATPRQSLEAAAQVARDHGVDVVMLGDDIEGESQVVARGMARLPDTVDRPTVFISGGETTVTLDGCKGGRGGRNTEFALALALALDARTNVWALAGDTDGEDGANLGAAGAVIAPDTLARAQSAQLDAAWFLARHDSGSFFATLDDLVTTGPTRTNVNDFRAILVLPQSGN